MRGLVMRKIVEPQWAPTTLRTLRKLMTKYEQGVLVLNTPWSSTAGRPRAVTQADVTALISDFDRGAVYDTAAIGSYLSKRRTDLVRSSGGVPMVGNGLSTSTLTEIGMTEGF